jgi:hypothetical protein
MVEGRRLQIRDLGPRFYREFDWSVTPLSQAISRGAIDAFIREDD